MPSEDELDEFGEWERAAWEHRADAYAAAIGDLTRGSIPALLDAASVGAGTRLLDVGTGPGFVAVSAIERGAVVQAVDQSMAMVAIAGAAGVDTQAASVEALPFSDRSFDAVVAGYLLNHLARPEAAIAELDRVLDVGGRLAMTVWDIPIDNPAMGLFGPIVTELGLTGVVPNGPDSQRFSAESEVRALLSEWDDVTVRRPRWVIDVDPGAWFDAIADGTPRTGAVLAQASPPMRSQARARYVELATSRYGTADGRVVLPAGAMLASATKRREFDRPSEPG